ncbi:MAG: glycosyltransferase family 39 protein [Caldilineaceae bacterium]
MTATAPTFTVPTPATTRQRLFLLLGLLSGFALRLFHLGSASLWYDETVSVVLARKSVAAMVAHTAGDIHPPGYYVLLHWWQQLTAPSLQHGLEFLFAWPSLWWGMVVVALVYALGRRLFPGPTAVLALWLTALHPDQIWYSQEVRMYTLGTLLGLLVLWAFINYCHRRAACRQPKEMALVAALCHQWPAGLYTLYYFLFLLVALNALALFSHMRQSLIAPPKAPIQQRRSLYPMASGAGYARLTLVTLVAHLLAASHKPTRATVARALELAIDIPGRAQREQQCAV